MMDAASPMLDVVSLLASNHGDQNETAAAGGGSAGLLSGPVSNYPAMPDAGFPFEADMPYMEQENWMRVPANWLDAMPAERYEQDMREEDAITACNSDDNGLYRMFRNLSP